MFYKAQFKRDDWKQTITIYGDLPELLTFAATKKYELVDYEVDPDYAKIKGVEIMGSVDLSPIIDLALATHDEAWFLELTGRQRA